MAAKKKGTTARAASIPARVRAGAWLDVAALVAAVLATVSVGRLFYFGAWVQLGLIATSPLWAAAAGAAAVLIGLPIVLGAFSVDVAAVALAGVAAFAIHWLIGRKPRWSDWIAYGVIGLIVANMWATTLYVNAPRPSGDATPAAAVAASPKLGVDWNDTGFYRRVLSRMRSGEGFYVAYRAAFNENLRWAMDPPSVFSYRLPTAFWFWRYLPGGPIAPFAAWLVLSTAVIAAVTRLTRHRVRLAVALPAAAAIASYLITFGTSVQVLLTEAWAASLGVLAVAAVVESYSSRHWRRWTLAAVSLALLACLTRELMVFLPVAGVAAALLVRDERGRFRAMAWGACLAAFASAYIAHIAAIGGAVSGVKAALAFSSGGLRFFADAFSWATEIIGGGAPVIVAFAVMAATGIWLTPDRGEKWFLALAAALPLTTFLLVGNDARDLTTGQTLNYWGTVVIPVLIALSPWGFAMIPGLAKRDSAAAKPRR
jgi:hypothetical protein